MPIRVDAAKTEVELVRNNAAKTDADFVRVDAAKTVAYQKSDPVSLIIETGVGTGWCQTYRATGPVSGGSNRSVLAYAGVDGWNSENEHGLMGIHDLAGVVAALQARPTVVGDGAVKIWSGFKRTSGAGDLWFGWTDQFSEPGSLPARYHPETDLTYATPVPWTRPGAAGALNQQVAPNARVQNIVDDIRNGLVGGVWLSSDAGDINANWGWFAGSSRSTTNGSGISGGITGVSPGEQYVARLELTIDF